MNRVENHIEGDYGPPPKLFMPTPEYIPPKIHPLVAIAQQNADRVHEAMKKGFDPMAVLAYSQVAEELATAGFTIPKVLIIGKTDDDHDYFVASPKFPWNPDEMTFSLLLKPSSMRVDRRQAVTIDGRVVEMDYTGIIFTDFLKQDSDNPDESDELLGLLARHLHEKPAPPTHLSPEIFTYRTMFNPGLADWPDIRISSDLKKLEPAERFRFLHQVVFAGLDALSNEAKGKYIRLTASRILEMFNSDPPLSGTAFFPNASFPDSMSQPIPGGNFNQLIPKPYSPAYVPDLSREEGELLGSVLYPKGWIDKVLNPKTRVLALAYLLRAASFARDDYFGKLRGSHIKSHNYKEVLGYVETRISNLDTAQKRADSLAVALIKEAEEWDREVFLTGPIEIDDYLRTAYDKYLRPDERIGFNPYGYYDDPPNSSDFRGGSGGDDSDDDGSRNIPRIPSPSLAI